MRITRYPLNGAGARKRDPISDPLSPPNETATTSFSPFLSLCPPTILDSRVIWVSARKGGRGREEKLARFRFVPLARYVAGGGWISFKLEISMAG